MPPIDRTPREKETRAETVHEESWRPPGSFPMDFTRQPGYRYRYVRTHHDSVLEDKGNMARRMQAGWRPVKAEEVPELDYLRDAAGNISVGGTTLCKNSEETVQRIQRYYDQMALGNLEGAASEFESSQHPLMPKFSEGNLRTRVIRGR